MILSLIEEFGPWSWWVLGLVLLALEIVAPGTFFLWFGLAALIVGAVALFVDFSWQMQAIAFVALAVVLVVLGRRYFARERRPGDQPLLNERATRLVGKVYPLAEPIIDGNGRIKVDDTTWRVQGPDLPAGSHVKVLGVDGAVLRVEAA